MSRVYTALLEKYTDDATIMKELRITPRHLDILKTDSKRPRWLTLSLVRDHQINILYIEGISKKKFLTS